MPRKIKSTALQPDQQFTGSVITIPSGTSAQRPASPSIGMLRNNIDIGNLEQYTSSGWQSIEPPPIIVSISPTSYNGEAGTTINISGSNFKAGATVQFITKNGIVLNASTTTVISGSQISAPTPRDITINEEPISIRVTNQSGLFFTLADALDAGSTPTWITAAGLIATIYDNTTLSTAISANDPDADSTITYSIYSGNLPDNCTLNANTGEITGNIGILDNDTTYTFTARATDNAGNTNDRAFSISVIATNYFGTAIDGTGSF